MNNEFKISDAERRFIENSIADKRAIISELKKDNADGRYDNEITALENEISGLLRFLGR